MQSQIWEDFLKIIREEVGSRVVETWFKAVSLTQWDSFQGVAYLEVPNSFVRDWIKNNYMALIQFHLGRLLNVHEPKIIMLDKREKNSADEESIHKKNETATVSENVPKKTSVVKIVPAKVPGNINRFHSFDTFVVGPHNSLACAAASAIIENPGMYNPLFICSGSGLGKTHLLHAIGNRMRAVHKKSVVLYQATDRFVNEFVHSVRGNRIQQFQAKYNRADVLLLDDIQVIANKEQTQEAFFNIFNGLFDAHKQIVFSGDTPPHSMNGIMERLRSRLSCGLVADIESPSLETKIAILQQKAVMHHAELDDDVASFIASNSMPNIRDLEGSLVRVLAFASLTKQTISEELVRKVLVRPAVQATTSVDCKKIFHVVQRHYPYSIDEICSKRRQKDLAFVRHVAIYLMKKYTDKSLREIGRMFGGRDHATIMHALEKMACYVQIKSDFQQKLQRIESDLIRS